MKRGLIVWDESELPRSTLEKRLDEARSAARAHDLHALVVYADVWRSNHARSLVNFMPFWGRSLLVVPSKGPPVLLCGNSPRVYPWLATVTLVEELRPTKDFAARLLELASERAWTRVGALERSRLPYDMDRALADSTLKLVDVEPWPALLALDATELAMRRRAIGVARHHVEREIACGGATTERDLAAALEGALRRAGMEDVLIRTFEGLAAPRLASERPVDETTSVFVACEYRGHWAQLTRPLRGMSAAQQHFRGALEDLRGFRGKRFDLTGPLPYQATPWASALEPGRLLGIHLETEARTYFGDTCLVGPRASAGLL